MYDNYSPRARRLLIALSQDEAYYLGSNTVEVEHIILALLKSADGLGYLVLQSLHINVLTLQLAIEQSIPSRSVQTVLKTTPFSERTINFLSARKTGQGFWDIPMLELSIFSCLL